MPLPEYDRPTHLPDTCCECTPPLSVPLPKAIVVGRAHVTCCGLIPSRFGSYAQPCHSVAVYEAWSSGHIFLWPRGRQGTCSRCILLHCHCAGPSTAVQSRSPPAPGSVSTLQVHQTLPPADTPTSSASDHQ